MGLFRTNYKKNSDEELMLYLGKGDKGAFDELYLRYADNLCYFIMRKLKHDREKGEDFVHDIFAKLIERPELFDVTRTFKTWIYSVANNMCKNEYKKMEVRSNTSNGLDSSYNVSMNELSATEVMHNAQFKEALAHSLDQMDEKHKEVFELRFFQELSIKEIAEVMEINDGTVKSRLFYATKRLSESLAIFDPNLNREV
ncbi:MAG: RNA polymerase sigma factor [Crocinitomicaceae bacterium]|nr:RNA polymerase sigma factor [Crocinitomicaceae bacterium]